MRDLPELLRAAERRVNAHVWPTRSAQQDDHLASIPANRDTDTDLLLMEAAERIEKLEAAGDRLAHLLLFKDHAADLSAWWDLRGGVNKCTVCNPADGGSEHG